MTHRFLSLLPLFFVLFAWSARDGLAQCVPGNENSHTLNVSTDLTEIGESSNMRPDDPNQDSTGCRDQVMVDQQPFSMPPRPIIGH